LKISDLYSMDVYSDAGQYLGEVHDAIIDLEKGEVIRILMDEWRTADREEVKRLLQQKSVLFKNVKNVGDVVLVSASALNQRMPESSASQEVNELARR
jgi:sporulation protein YlmC with PRC-barrel domain